MFTQRSVATIFPNLEDLLYEGFSKKTLLKNPKILQDRAAQQNLIANIPNIVNLSAPGSQKANYEIDEDGRPKRVYYASFGSNLFLDRFSAYIAGGQPEGSSKSYGGSRDKTLPTDNIPIALNGTIHYVGESKIWTGGAAFLDTGSRGKALGKAYQITPSQFEDVVAQECGMEPGEKEIDFISVIEKGRHEGSGLYGTLVHVGDHNNIPVFTFTGAFNTKHASESAYVVTTDGEFVKSNSDLAKPQEGKEDPFQIFPNSPSEAYRKQISEGLRQTHGLTQEQIDIYFRGSTGVIKIINPII
jgi:hypothetical protein